MTYKKKRRKRCLLPTCSLCQQKEKTRQQNGGIAINPLPARRPPLIRDSRLVFRPPRVSPTSAGSFPHGPVVWVGPTQVERIDFVTTLSMFTLCCGCRLTVDLRDCFSILQSRYFFRCALTEKLNKQPHEGFSHFVGAQWLRFYHSYNWQKLNMKSKTSDGNAKTVA